MLLHLAGAAAVWSAGGAAEGQAPLADDYVCEAPAYKVHMVSKSPLVLYITDFVTAQERAHLREATYGSHLSLCLVDSGPSRG